MLYSTNFHISKRLLNSFTHISTLEEAKKFVYTNYLNGENTIYLIDECMPDGSGMKSLICLADTNMCIDTEDVLKPHLIEKTEILKSTKTDFNPIMTTADINLTDIQYKFCLLKSFKQKLADGWHSFMIYVCNNPKQILNQINLNAKKLTVIDGHHRLNACRKCRYDKIMVSITPKNELMCSFWIPFISNISIDKVLDIVSKFQASSDVLYVKIQNNKKWANIPVPKTNYFDTIKKILDKCILNGGNIEYISEITTEVDKKLKEDSVVILYDEDFSIDYFLTHKLPPKTTNFVKHSSSIFAYLR